MKRKKLKRNLILFALLYLVAEITIRGFYSWQTDISFFLPSRLYLKYYPELREVLENPETPEGHARLLVLGGSAVNVNFCNFHEFLGDYSNAEYKDFYIDTLAQYAQNSLDSWYKYQMLESIHYDYVVFYHGINDARTNNCPADLFDINYRHVSFYNEIYILFRHPEINVSILPWFIDLSLQKLFEASGVSKKIPKEYNILEYYHEKKISNKLWWDEGKDLKSSDSFERNLNNIYALGKEKGDQLFLITYANYLPEDYSLENFVEQNLGYDGHAWPVEIYGDPDNIKAGIDAHNHISLALSKKNKDILFLDFEGLLGHNGIYYQDICHLTDLGCGEMGAAVRQTLDNSSTK